MKLGSFPLVLLAYFILVLTFSLLGWAETGANPSGRYFLYVGTYTKGESKGIYVYSYDAQSGESKSLGLAAETPNPSFLAVDPRQRFLYAVNELTQYKGSSSGAVTSFAIEHKTGKLSPTNEVASRGADPCYISLDKTGKYVLVANYTGGSVAVFPVHKDGGLGDATAFVQHAGTGKNPTRQDGPHAHWIETTPDNRFALAADLGLDEVLVYRFDANRGTLAPNDPPFAKVEAGAGPRHIAFHPNGKVLYVIDELASTVAVFSFDPSKGTLHLLQSLSTLPSGFSGNNDTAEIHVHPNGKFLFASNRGHDSIAVFSIDQKTGTLTVVDHFSTQGKTPRNFELDPTGTRLLVANQDSDNIVLFNIDLQTGHLTATGQLLKVPSPVSLRFVAAQ
jgi:6-phosphogluconolactonase